MSKMNIKRYSQAMLDDVYDKFLIIVRLKIS